MAAVRKSDVSKTATGFRRGSTPSSRSRKRRDTRLESGVRNALTRPPQASSVPTVTQPSYGKNLSLPVITGQQNRGKMQSSPTLNSSQSNVANLPVVPTATAMPMWLMRLKTLHHNSSLVAFLLVSASLVVYGLTVYTQERWGKEYRRLQNLQRNERQITTTNATLINKMAEEAEQKATGLVSPNPANTIFLSPRSPNSDFTSPRKETESSAQSSTASPLGY